MIAPQPSGMPKPEEATQEVPIKRKGVQDSGNNSQIPVIIAPPIKLPLRNISPETDVGDQVPENQP